MKYNKKFCAMSASWSTNKIVSFYSWNQNNIRNNKWSSCWNRSDQPIRIIGSFSRSWIWPWPRSESRSL